VGGFVIEVDDPWRRTSVRFSSSNSFRQERRPEDVYALELDGPPDPAITFFSLRFDGELLGVGAIKLLGPDHAELKSMHTAVAARRRGVGRAMVNHLLAVAAERGIRRVSLETGAGEAFAPARSLYAAAGLVRAVRRLPGEPEQLFHDAAAELAASPSSSQIGRRQAGFSAPRLCFSG
jgi:GNAT superfamily N-acetyltransferase